MIQRRAWLQLGRLNAERSCPCKQPICPVVGSGSEVTFKPLIPRLIVRESGRKCNSDHKDNRTRQKPRSRKTISVSLTGKTIIGRNKSRTVIDFHHSYRDKGRAMVGAGGCGGGDNIIMTCGESHSAQTRLLIQEVTPTVCRSSSRGCRYFMCYFMGTNQGPLEAISLILRAFRLSERAHGLVYT
ncbi:hypothetical protein J6590_034450 [Homalodisca vitripennis]|nr:hypothetical protein J6590_034450 [Homalodisca vitripennis]